MKPYNRAKELKEQEAEEAMRRQAEPEHVQKLGEFGCTIVSSEWSTPAYHVGEGVELPESIQNG